MASMHRPRERILLTLAAASGLFAVYVGVTGGFDTRIAGIAVRSRSWERPAACAVVLATFALIRARREVVRAFRRRGATGASSCLDVANCAGPAAVLATCWAATVAVGFGSFVAGGSDSYGYVSQAELLARGRLTEPLAINPAFTWPNVPGTFMPHGYVVGHTGDVLVPTYPPGLPLIMAALALIDSRAVFLVVPVFTALAVWCCWRLGLCFEDRLAGSLAAVLLALSPTFLYQAVQPMSDVPVTACWMGALLLARHPRGWAPAAAGAVASLAVLIRPNLAPLGLLIAAAAATTATNVNVRRAVSCLVCMVPGLVTLGLIQYVRYGAPLASGYGSFHDLFSLRNVPPNLARYPRWLVETHTLFIWLWLLAPAWIRTVRTPVRRFAWICYGFSAAVVLAYLPYFYFGSHEWFYSRFMLPAVPLMLLLNVLLCLHVARAWLGRVAEPAVVLLVLGLGVIYGMRAESVGTFAVKNGEQKYPLVGRFVRDHLPASAVVMARQHSGSIRYYSGRQTFRWDGLAPGSLDRAIADLNAAGHEVYLVADPDETPEFVNRFKSPPQEALRRLTRRATVRGVEIYVF